MNRKAVIFAAALLALPALAQARGHVDVGIGIGVGPPVYYGPSYYGPSPYYYPYAPYDYGPRYYGPPRYRERPRPEYDEERGEQEQAAPAANWYYCRESKTYYPYVKECAEGWQAVPARGPQVQPPADAAPAPVAPNKVVFRFGDLLFAPNRAELQPTAEASLRSLLASIRHEPFRRVTIEGHTDSSGNQEANRELSRRRAESVRQYLIGKGIPADKITAVGKGEDDPIAGNNTADGRQLNRRVDVIVS